MNTKFSYNNSIKREVIFIEELLNIIQKKDNKIITLEEENQYLKEKLDSLIREKYTPKSEKFNSNQPSLFGDEEEIVIVEEDTEVIEYTRKKGGRRKPSKDLPRVRVEHDIPQEEKICSCGCKMHVIKELVSEQYDIVPTRFQVIENVRFVYGCRCGEKPKTTPVPPMILRRSQITASFLATVACTKV